MHIYGKHLKSIFVCVVVYICGERIKTIEFFMHTYETKSCCLAYIYVPRYDDCDDGDIVRYRASDD